MVSRWCDGSAADASGAWLHGRPAVYGTSDNRTSFVNAMYRMAIETPLNEMPRLARGKQDQFHHCQQRRGAEKTRCSCATFQHESRCRRLGVLEATRRLISRKQRLIFVGDSVMNQLWLTTWKARRAATMGAIGLLRWPHMAVSVCVPPSDAAIEFVMDRALRGAVGSGNGSHRWQDAKCGEDDALLLSIGLWYNLQNASCAPADFGGLRREILNRSAVLRQYQSFPRASPPLKWPLPADVSSPKRSTNDATERACRELTPSRWAPGNMDLCSTDVFGGQCLERAHRHALSQCDYARDLRALARWLHANHQRLPRRIFFLDSPLQRIVGAKNEPEIVRFNRADAGRWRNAIARSTFERYAPTVRYVRFEEMLQDAPRRTDGQSAHLDAAHWCIDSLAWEEATSVVLTAVVAHTPPHVKSADGEETQTDELRCDLLDRLPAREGPPVAGWPREVDRR